MFVYGRKANLADYSHVQLCRKGRFELSVYLNSYFLFRFLQKSKYMNMTDNSAVINAGLLYYKTTDFSSVVIR